MSVVCDATTERFICTPSTKLIYAFFLSPNKKYSKGRWTKVLLTCQGVVGASTVPPTAPSLSWRAIFSWILIVVRVDCCELLTLLYVVSVPQPVSCFSFLRLWKFQTFCAFEAKLTWKWRFKKHDLITIIFLLNNLACFLQFKCIIIS